MLLDLLDERIEEDDLSRGNREMLLNSVIARVIQSPILIILFGLSTIACDANDLLTDYSNDDEETDEDTGVDGDSDMDNDTDIDTETDTDRESDADVDSDTDSDTDADADTDTDTDTDIDSDVDTDADMDTDADVDADSDSDTDDDGAIITASGENSDNGETKEMAFDGNDNTKWLTFEDSCWIQYDYAGDVAKVVRGYSITSANAHPERDPKAWRLLDSNNGTSWTTLDERPQECFSDRLQKKTYRVDNNQAYKMYKLDISSNNDPASANSTQISEIALLQNGDGGIEPGGDGGCAGQTVGEWKFVAVGDSRGSDDGVNTSVWGHLVDAIIDEDAKFVLFPGDLTSGGDDEEFARWLEVTQPLYDANIGVYVVRGNHDDDDLPKWNDAFDGKYELPQNGPTDQKNITYFVEYENVLVVAMDNYSGTEIHQSWLDERLAANSLPHVFAFGHEPAFAADHSDCLDDDRSMRDEFWQSLKNAGVRAYFAGHDHFYDHAQIKDGDGDSSNDLHQFIVGTAGAPLYDFDGDYSGKNGDYNPVQKKYLKKYGYLVVAIDGWDVHMRFMARNGDSYQEADSFDYTAN